MNDPPVTVVRLAHRPGRDDRMTTHVALVARALGADRVILPERATDAAETARDVTDRFGGPFAVEQVADPKATVMAAEGLVVHLTMYGERIQDVIEAIRTDAGIDGDPTTPVTIVIGAGKVPFEIYDRADYNVAVTNQPHSEVAALGIFLERLFDGATLADDYRNANRRVVPTDTGKDVREVE